MLKVIVVLVAVALIVFTAVLAVQADSEQTRHLPKIVWLLAIIAVPGLGALAWWLLGRPTGHTAAPVVAPDDDPDFLRRLRHLGRPD